MSLKIPAIPIAAASVLAVSSAHAKPLEGEHAALEACELLLQREGYPKEVRTVGGDINETRYLVRASMRDGLLSLECEYRGLPLKDTMTREDREKMDVERKLIETAFRKKGIPMMRELVREKLKRPDLAVIENDKAFQEAVLKYWIELSRDVLRDDIEKAIEDGRRQIQQVSLVKIYIGEKRSDGTYQYLDSTSQDPETGANLDLTRWANRRPDGIVNLVRRILAKSEQETEISDSYYWHEKKRKRRLGKKEHAFQAQYGELARRIRDAIRENQFFSPRDEGCRLYAGDHYEGAQFKRRWHKRAVRHCKLEWDS